MRDDELVSAAQGGDVEAFAVLVERHRSVALRVAYGIADGEADDVAHDAFLKAFRHLEGFRTGGSFRAWLLRIVANEARNRRRGFVRRNALVLRVRDEPPGGAAEDPVEGVVRRLLGHGVLPDWSCRGRSATSGRTYLGG